VPASLGYREERGKEGVRRFDVLSEITSIRGNKKLKEKNTIGRKEREVQGSYLRAGKKEESRRDIPIRDYSPSGKGRGTYVGSGKKKLIRRSKP